MEEIYFERLSEVRSKCSKTGEDCVRVESVPEVALLFFREQRKRGKITSVPQRCSLVNGGGSLCERMKRFEQDRTERKGQARQVRGGSGWRVLSAVCNRKRDARRRDDARRRITPREDNAPLQVTEGVPVGVFGKRVNPRMNYYWCGAPPLCGGPVCTGGGG